MLDPDDEARFAEEQRLAVLARTGLLDTPNDPVFDRYTRLAATVAGTQDAYVSLIDRDRQWFKARLGGVHEETPRSWAICRYAVEREGLLEVEDASRDPRFQDSPLVSDDGGIRFYAGVPLRIGSGMGRPALAVGTLCVTAPEPRALTPAQRAGLIDLAALLMREIETNHLAEVRAGRAAAARAAAVEIEHQMRNLFSRIGAVIEMAAREAPSPRALADEARRRIVALSHANEVAMRNGFAAAPLAEVAAAALRPLRDRTGLAIPAGGEPTLLTPAAASVLAPWIDELAHDAVARGALRAEGDLRLRWRHEGDQLVLTWSEASPPGEDAYASTYLTGTVPAALRAEARPSEQGYELRVPLGAVQVREDA